MYSIVCSEIIDQGEKRDVSMHSPILISFPDLLPPEDFFARIRFYSESGSIPLAFYRDNSMHLVCIMTDYIHLEALACDCSGLFTYPSLAIDYPAFSVFEREVYEESGILPAGHPWLKPMRQAGLRSNAPNQYPFMEFQSSSMHEVGVGPVHAGVIEPGHFRFLCIGEEVKHLEICLGYQHRGVAKLFRSGDIREKIYLAESIAGDTTIGHALAYAMAVEAICQSNPSSIPERMIALELERIAMHLADLSALSGDIAYIMGQNIFAALRTTVINTSLSICGSRFGKRWICPGGVNYPLTADKAKEVCKTLAGVWKQTHLMVEGMLGTAGVLSRFDDTGKVSKEDCLAFGFTGTTAKATGLAVDVRLSFPMMPIEDFYPITHDSGDVYARFWVRCQEIAQSISMIEQLSARLDEAKLMPMGDITSDSIAISLVEGWRGRIVHICQSASAGIIDSYRIIDPSLHNWFALALCMRGEGISDFPLCNKSFDLSYCGSDL